MDFQFSITPSMFFLYSSIGFCLFSFVPPVVNVSSNVFRWHSSKVGFVCMCLSACVAAYIYVFTHVSIPFSSNFFLIAIGSLIRIRSLYGE